MHFCLYGQKWKKSDFPPHLKIIYMVCPSYVRNVMLVSTSAKLYDKSEALLSDAEKGRIIEAHENGLTIKEISNKFKCGKIAIFTSSSGTTPSPATSYHHIK